ncbi:MAG: hypothetical protein NUV67_01320 [archaeon]|nr:hypothetical protein [archaeon]
MKGSFSLEATVALFALIAIIIAMPPPAEQESKIVSKHLADDALTIWARENAGPGQMETDAEMIFGKGNYKINSQTEKENADSSAVLFPDKRRVSIALHTAHTDQNFAP